MPISETVVFNALRNSFYTNVSSSMERIHVYVKWAFKNVANKCINNNVNNKIYTIKYFPENCTLNSNENAFIQNEISLLLSNLSLLLFTHFIVTNYPLLTNIAFQRNFFF